MSLCNNSHPQDVKDDDANCHNLLGGENVQILTQPSASNDLETDMRVVIINHDFFLYICYIVVFLHLEVTQLYHSCIVSWHAHNYMNFAGLIYLKLFM